jgi:hypothetical protein
MILETSSRAGSGFSETDWECLLAFVQERRVIPILGPGLSLVKDPASGQSLAYSEWLAVQLARKLNLPEKENLSLDQVVCSYLQTGRSTKGLFPMILNLVGCNAFPVPQPLLDIAAITDFKLLITTTFDGLLAKAMTQARSGIVPHELAYSPKQFDDLTAPLETIERPVVYQLFGKVAAIGRFAICDENVLEWIAALQSATYAPERLTSELKNHHLLLLGLNHHDWLARFFVRTVKREPLSQDRDWHEYLTEPTEETEPNLVTFFRTCSKSTILVNGQGGAVQFASELRRRWEACGRKAVPASGISAPLRFLPPDREMPPNAVFLSYSRPDLEAVKALKSGLDEAGVVTWFDMDRLEGGDAYAKKIHDNIKSCSFFIPVISEDALKRNEAFFWREWRWAEDRTFDMAQGALFIIPVIIDETSPTHQRIPEKFCDRDVFRLPGGRPTPAFLSRLKTLLSGGRQ